VQNAQMHESSLYSNLHVTSKKSFEWRRKQGREHPILLNQLLDQSDRCDRKTARKTSPRARFSPSRANNLSRRREA
jgi:hypothetical protein